MYKKCLAFLLAVSIILSELPAAALAAEVSEDTVDATSEIEQMSPDEYAIYKQELAGSESAVGAAKYTLENEYIEIAQAINGRYTIGTIEGDPASSTDNNKKLLYGHPSPATSHTTVVVDNKAISFSADSSTKNGNSITSVMNYNDIQITQTLSIVQNETTGRRDMVKISYVMKNTSDQTKSVGGRIMMDTMLGSNDGAPFRVNGSPIVTEREYTGYEIPQYWQAFDSLDDPSVISNGTVYKSISEKPDKMQIAAWGGVTGTIWNYSVSELRKITGDSAVTYIYNPKSLESGASRSFSTYYGIGQLTNMVDIEGFGVYVSAPEKLSLQQSIGNYYPNPFLVSCYVKNNTDAVVKDATISCLLPESSPLTIMDEPSRVIGDMEPGDEKTVTFKVLAQTQSVLTQTPYSIKLSGEGQTDQTYQGTITLPKVRSSISNNAITLDKTTLNLDLVSNTTETLKATYPSSIESVTFSSTNANVATVSKTGKVTAKGVGEANIIVSGGGKTASCHVTVVGELVEVQSVTLPKSSMNLLLNQTYSLKASVLPANAFNKRIVYTSSSPSVVSVTAGGKITAKSTGTATITAKTEDGKKSASCVVTVINGNESISIDGMTFNETITGPSVNIKGDTVPLFELPYSLEIEGFDGVKLTYDNETKKYTAVFGDFSDDFDTENVSDRQKLYRDIKELLGTVGKKTNREFYNKYRSLTKKGGPLSITAQSTAFGYVEFTAENGQLKFSSGEMGFLASADADYKVPVWGPVCFKVGLSGELQTGLRLTLESDHNFVFSGSLEAATALSAAVGVDAAVASAYGGIEGSLEGAFNFPVNRKFNKLTDLSVSAALSAFLEIEALGIFGHTYRWKFADFDLWPGNHSTQSVLNSSVYGASSLRNNLWSVSSLNGEEVVSQNVIYVSNLDGMPLLPRRQSIGDTSVGAALDSNETLIESDIMPSNNAKRYDLGNGETLLLYIDDDTSRSDANRSALYYRLETGAGDSYHISAPVLIDDDGTCDFDFSAVVHDGNVYIAFMDSNQVFDDSDVDLNFVTAASHYGITLATMDISTKSVELTSVYDTTGAMCDKPSIAICNGEPVITWISRAVDNDKIYNASDELKYCTWNENTPVIHTLLSDSNGSAVFTDDIGSVIAIDTRIENTTTLHVVMSAYVGEDVRIVELSCNAETAEAGSTSTYGDTSVRAGNPIFAGDSIVYVSGNQILTNTGSVLAENVSCSTDLYYMTSGDTEMIYWIDTADVYTQCKGIIAKGDDAYSKPVTLIKETGRAVTAPAGILKNDVLSFVSTYRTYNDSTDKYDDTSNETFYTDADFVYTETDMVSDLEVYPDSLAVVSDIVAGEEVTLSLSAKNTGLIKADYVIAQIYDNDDELFAQVPANINLLPGDTIDNLEISYPLPSVMSTQKITVKLLPASSATTPTEDRDESDNVYNAVDLRVANIEMHEIIPQGKGYRITLPVTVTNSGYSDSDSLSLYLYQNINPDENLDNDDILLDTIPIYTLASQDSFVQEIALNTSKLTNEEDFNMLSLYAVVRKTNDSKTVYGKETFVIENPNYTDPIDISYIGSSGNKLVFCLDNFYANLIEGQLCIEAASGDRLYESMSIDAFAKELLEVDLSALNVEQAQTMNICIIGEDGAVISNIKEFPVEPLVVDHMTSFTLLKEPTKTVYREGDIFEAEGIELVAAYESGESESIDWNDCTYSANILEPSTETVTISYQGFEISLPITVYPIPNKFIDQETAAAQGDAAKVGYVEIKFKKKSTEYTYTGSEIKPAIQATYTYTEYNDKGVGKVKKLKLKENADYEVVYENNINAGTADVIVTGIGDYCQEQTLHFTILPKDITKCKVETIPNFKYTGSNLAYTVRSAIVVSDKGRTLSTSDYTVSFNVAESKVTTLRGSASENTIVTVDITDGSSGNYTGVLKNAQTFTILADTTDKTNISNTVVTIKKPKKGFIYSGKTIKPTVTVTDSANKKLKAKRDYTVVYKNNINAGSASVVIVGKGNYYGSTSSYFSISKKNASKLKVGSLGKIIYRDEYETLNPVVKDGSKVLTKDTDYTVTMPSSSTISLIGVKLQKVEISVTAKYNSNYSGTKKATFYVVPRSLTNRLSARIIVENVTADKTAISAGVKPKVVVTYKNIPLTEGEDYTLTYKKNKKAGKGQVTVKGINSYSGKRNISFVIEEQK